MTVKLQNPSDKSLQEDTSNTQSRTDQSPSVGQFGYLWPERVLLLPERLVVGELLGLRLVSPSLASFVLAVSADVSEESPVGEGRQERERVEQVVGIEEEWVGKVNELVTEVARLSVVFLPM